MGTTTYLFQFTEIKQLAQVFPTLRPQRKKKN